MTESLISFLQSVQLYTVPIVFALGLILFFYGAIHSFVLGRSTIGNPFLIRASIVLGVGVLIYLILAGLIMLFSMFTLSGNNLNTDNNRSNQGAEIKRERSVLPVPNVPGMQ